MWVVAWVVGVLVLSAPAAHAGPKAETSGPYWTVSAGYLSAPGLHFDTGVMSPGADVGPGHVDFRSGQSFEFASGIRRQQIRWEAIGLFERLGAEGSVFEGIELVDSVAIARIEPIRGSASNFSFLAGGCYDFASPWRDFGPYIGGAVGISRASFDVTATTGMTVVGDPAYGLALRGVAGANMHLRPGVDAFVEGRYRRLGPFRVYVARTPIQDVVLDGWGIGTGIRLSL